MTYLVDTSVQTVDDIVANVITSCRLPISQVTFTPQNLIQFLDDEQKLTVTSLIKRVREDYWLTNFDQPILTGLYSYPMPPRAAAGALRDLCFVDASGNEIVCPHLDPDQIKTQPYSYSWQSPGAFLQDASVVLWPQNVSNTAYKLRQKYERRPNSLTSTSNCMKITGVNFGANQLTFAGSPPFTAGQSIDIIAQTGQFTSQGDDLVISVVPGGTITMTTPIPATVTVGSWACPSGLTCIPQLPAEGYALLLARGMLRVAAGLQNTNLFSVASKMAEDAAAKLTDMVTPRVSGSPKKFVNRNILGGRAPFFR